MRLPVKHAAPLAALILLAACGSGSGGKPVAAAAPRNGPAADYPMVIGDPFTISGITYTPDDKLNSDEVGYAAIGEAGGTSVSAAHKTLPLPSYVEVTSLESGKTILVRLERRGPMSNDFVIELSPGAAAQLGLVRATKSPVRVRRVNPPEPERAMLRSGGQAPERMETPKGLLAVLSRKLDAQEPLRAAQAAPATSGSATAPLAPPSGARSSPKPAVTSMPEPEPAMKPAPATKPEPKPDRAGSLIVQVAAFSREAGAKSVASKLGGKVIKPGKYWLTRLGPYATRAEAEAALAKARAAGYSDARIQRAD